jgi:hypothetical protein
MRNSLFIHGCLRLLTLIAQAIAAKDPGGIVFLDQLVRYVPGPAFAPAVSLPEAALQETATE